MLLAISTTHESEFLESAEPVLVDFCAPWRPPCRAMNPVVQSLACDFKVCKVNVDKNRDLAAHYGVSSIPVFLILKNGEIVANHLGVTSEATLRAELEKFQES